MAQKFIFTINDFILQAGVIGDLLLGMSLAFGSASFYWWLTSGGRWSKSRKSPRDKRALKWAAGFFVIFIGTFAFLIIGKNQADNKDDTSHYDQISSVNYRSEERPNKLARLCPSDSEQA